MFSDESTLEVSIQTPLLHFALELLFPPDGFLIYSGIKSKSVHQKSNSSLPDSSDAHTNSSYMSCSVAKPTTGIFHREEFSMNAEFISAVFEQRAS